MPAPKATVTATLKAFDGKVVVNFSADLKPENGAAAAADINDFYKHVNKLVDDLNNAGVDKLVWGG